MQNEKNKRLLLEKINLSGYNIYIGSIEWKYNERHIWFYVYYNKNCKERNYRNENLGIPTAKPKKKARFSEEIDDPIPIFCYVLVCVDNVLDFFDSKKINIQTFIPKEMELQKPDEPDEPDEPDKPRELIDRNDDGTSDTNLTDNLNAANLNKDKNRRTRIHIQTGGTNVGSIIYITENDFVNIPTDDKITITGEDGSPVTLPGITITGKDGSPVTLLGTFTFYPESTYDPHKDISLLSQLKDGEVLIQKKNSNGVSIYAYNPDYEYDRTKPNVYSRRFLKDISSLDGGYKKYKKTQRRLNTRKKRKNNNKKKRTIRKIIKK